MRLIIDIGNTNAKLAVVHKGRFLTVERHKNVTEEALASLLAQYPVTTAICSSVRAGGEAPCAEWLRGNVKKMICFTPKTAIPVRNLYGTPETLGCDRLAAAVGAYALFPATNCMIIDCGTAITIDFVGQGGEFLGGNISPGLQTRFNALHTATGNLPLGQVTDTPQSIGTSTDTAIEAGVLQGALYEIEGYIEQNTASNIIFTGGDALFFAKHIKNPIFVVFNLVLVGLNKVIDYNAYYL
ncbi:MAG: type III pantothenate kinase [Prevotellaceae bacterium]|jgi:type III pantothenate kinase|nr:type III pantothenate kinase [Prevotellaceae bacterium]